MLACWPPDPMAWIERLEPSTAAHSVVVDPADVAAGGVHPRNQKLGVEREVEEELVDLLVDGKRDLLNARVLELLQSQTAGPQNHLLRSLQVGRHIGVAERDGHLGELDLPRARNGAPGPRGDRLCDEGIA
jgi:hypothetical protein